MSLSFNSSISGIRAATDMLSVSAHNIANSNTDGYKKQRVNLKGDQGGGVIAEITESTERGSLYKNRKGDTVDTSNVNYIEEVVTQIKARHLLSASAATIKYTDEAQKVLWISLLRTCCLSVDTDVIIPLKHHSHIKRNQIEINSEHNSQ